MKCPDLKKRKIKNTISRFYLGSAIALPMIIIPPYACTVFPQTPASSTPQTPASSTPTCYKKGRYVGPSLTRNQGRIFCRSAYGGWGISLLYFHFLHFDFFFFSLKDTFLFLIKKIVRLILQKSPPTFS